MTRSNRGGGRKVKKKKPCDGIGCGQMEDAHTVIYINADASKEHGGFGTVQVTVHDHWLWNDGWFITAPKRTMYFRGEFKNAYRRARNAARNIQKRAMVGVKINDYVTDFGKSSKRMKL